MYHIYHIYIYIYITWHIYVYVYVYIYVYISYMNIIHVMYIFISCAKKKMDEQQYLDLSLHRNYYIKM